MLDIFSKVISLTDNSPVCPKENDVPVFRGCVIVSAFMEVNPLDVDAEVIILNTATGMVYVNTEVTGTQNLLLTVKKLY